MRLVIGSRKSDLAKIQAYSVGKALQMAHPNLQINYQFRESLGDKNLVDPLWKMPERGVFTEDFYHDLLSGEIDLAVHSWKDLPTQEREGTLIAGTLKRADVRDILLIKKSRLSSIQKSGILEIYSSSPRRSFNTSEFFKWALPFKIEKTSFKDVRGNIPTRLKKFLSDDIDGIIVAKAAVDRLLNAQDEEFFASRRRVRQALDHSHFMILPLRINPAAPAQGALALEVAKVKNSIINLIDSISEKGEFLNINKERDVLASYGGGCHQKIGATALTRSYGDLFFLRGQSDTGVLLNQCVLKNFQKIRQAATLAHLWPSGLTYDKFFKRAPLQVSQPPSSENLWVSKAEALPASWTLSFDQTVWVSGLETWRKLASRGVWVHGSSESLGESEDPRLENLLEGQVSWTKLTHKEGPHFSSMKLMPTYELIPTGKDGSLEGKTHFYWMSGSRFSEALKNFPQIRDGFHGCGPGNTYEILKTYFRSDSGQLAVYLDQDDWRQKVVPQ